MYTVRYVSRRGSFERKTSCSYSLISQPIVTRRRSFHRQPHPELHSRKADVYNEDEVSRVPAGHDAVISAFSPDKTGSLDILEFGD